MAPINKIRSRLFACPQTYCFDGKPPVLKPDGFVPPEASCRVFNQVMNLAKELLPKVQAQEPFLGVSLQYQKKGTVGESMAQTHRYFQINANETRTYIYI